VLTSKEDNSAENYTIQLPILASLITDYTA